MTIIIDRRKTTGKEIRSLLDQWMLNGDCDVRITITPNKKPTEEPFEFC